MTRVLLFVLLLVLSGAGFYFYGHNVAPDKKTVPIEKMKPTETPVPETEDVSVGQLLMIGHFANTPVASTSALIQELHVGGVIIMSAPENIDDIASWIAKWQSVSDVPLLITIDQEGGPVSRLKGKDFIQTGQREIFTEEEAYRVGLERGQELAALGINMNFAPVLDQSTNPNSFMYSRTFPEGTNASLLAKALYQGMKEAGVTAVAKHFPGHPDNAEDSHTELPIVSIDKEGLPAFTKSFNDFILETNPLALMTAHVAFPKIDTVPATLSHFFLTEYVREQLGFSGMIITDDMSMNAIDDTWDTSIATVRSIQAGADMVLFAAEPEKAREAVATLNKALKNGELDKNEIKTKTERQRAALGKNF